ncbi:DEAD/DEAH box helicase [Treponema primitia]|uniref:DEAD/DEAH box helicase n=1 Tax=Treponema primitia TaxID=88058 RepID=UPI00025552BF|nr:DEAD/DEAH box helicase [Treponema primitia]
MEFSEFTLHPDLQRGIAEMGYVSCMPVQEQVLSSAFGGQDLYVQSQTGTGKTAAYLIVIFQRLLSEPLINGKKAIIMVPTRELAVQVEEEAKQLGKYLPFIVGSFYGGVGYVQQQQLLRDNAQILVGTPGRVLDLNSSGYMNLMDIAFLVLDEADRMFDMGFYPDLRKLIKVVPPADRRQTMLFSATLNAWVKNLAWEYTKTPHEIEIEPETVTVEEIEQVLYHVHSDEKMKFLMGILQREKPESAIIFCNTKKYTEIVAKRLEINGINCEFIMGDLPQSKRLKIIEDVKAGKTRFLVATDVAARGLDIDDLSMVINYDIPVEAENYVHRIGRTARAGKSGKAITLASEQDVYELPDIERYIGKKIPSVIADESLYGEDKSEGMRIRTDSYDDRGRRDDRGRDSRRDGRHGDGRRPGPGMHRGDGRRREGPPGAPHHSESPRHAGPRPHTDRPQGEAGAARSEGRDRRPGPRDGSGRGAPELASLSQEERMAYYKQKYEGKPGEDSAGKGQGRRGDQDQGRNTGRRGRDGGDRKPRDQRDGGKSPDQRPGSPRSADQRPGEKRRGGGDQRPGNQRPGGQRVGQAKRPNQVAQTTAKAAPQTGGQTAAKKGILGKILGIFRNRPKV